MSTTTANLGLFKYDTTTDGASPFNINTALNNNWDIIDTAVGTGGSPTTVVSGDTWYRQWSDGWKEQGGEVSLTSTDVDFIMPTLTANGTPGGDTYATWTNDTYSEGGSTPYHIFDKNTNTYWAGNGLNWVRFYSPIPVKLTEIYFINHLNGGGCNFSLSGSNNNEDWVFLTQTTDKLETYQTISITTSQYFKYFQILVTEYDGRPKIKELEFHGKYKTSVANSITFPVAFSNTNYSYTFANQDGGGMDAYVSNKTTTGMTLSNTNSGSASWTACGY